MAGPTRIYFAFVKDRKVKKLGESAPSRAFLGGDVTWWLYNETGADKEVVIQNFTNDDGENIDDYLNPKPPFKVTVSGAPGHNVGTTTATVQKDIPGTDVTFKYEVWFGGVKTDPELIVDGGRGGKGGKKKAKKKGTKKK